MTKNTGEIAIAIFASLFLLTIGAVVFSEMAANHQTNLLAIQSI